MEWLAQMRAVYSGSFVLTVCHLSKKWSSSRNFSELAGTAQDGGHHFTTHESGTRLSFGTFRC